MKFAVYRKCTEASEATTPGTSIWLTKNRRCEESEIQSGSVFLASRRGALYAWISTFKWCDSSGTITVLSGNVADTFDGQFFTPYWGDMGFLGWFYTDADGNEAQCLSSTPFSIYTSEVSAKWTEPIVVTYDATTNGGTCSIVSAYFHSGLPVPALPSVTFPSSQPLFMGWWTSASGGTRITEGTTYDGTYTKLYARFTTVGTQFTAQPTSSYKNVGIYSANRYSSSLPVVVDWGDGALDVINGSISQLAHTYANAGTYYVRINDNISTFAASASNSTWYNTTSQNRYTFKHLTQLGSHVTSFPTYAFYYCSAMNSIVWPVGMTSVPNYCFYYCQGITSWTLPSTLTSIGSYAFYYCYNSSFNSIIIPEGVTSISNNAFYYCYYLKNITLPSTLCTLGNYAFAYCFYYSSSAASITIPSGVTSIPAYCFYYCRYLQGISIPDTVTSIGNYAFYYCYYNLKSITIPSSVTTIGSQAFCYCYNLYEITCNRASAPTVQSNTFGSSTSYYTGRAHYSAGTNKLYVSSGATGYDSSYWSSVLLDSTKCGFTIENI